MGVVLHLTHSTSLHVFSDYFSFSQDLLFLWWYLILIFFGIRRLLFLFRRLTQLEVSFGYLDLTGGISSQGKILDGRPVAIEARDEVHSVATQQLISVDYVLQGLVVEVTQVGLAGGEGWPIVDNPEGTPFSCVILPVIEFPGK